MNNTVVKTEANLKKNTNNDCDLGLKNNLSSNLVDNDDVKGGISGDDISAIDISTLTPMMQQFITIKKEHKDYLLFYRMGDFYELFMEDALLASKALDITLTHRGQINDKPLPMCGVPAHSHEAYLHKLINKGFKVAICDQMEDPKEAKKRGYKAIVKREVTRIITPGTITEDGLLNASSSNYLSAINFKKDKYIISWVDISTGEFLFLETRKENVASEIARINPSEILIPDILWGDHEFNDFISDWKKEITPYTMNFFESTKGKEKVKNQFNIKFLDSIGEVDNIEYGCIGALIEYIDLTQKGNMPKIDIPRRFVVNNHMVIDNAARKNLEINKTLNGDSKGSLFNIINNTSSSSGARLLYSYMNNPLLDVKEIESRHDVVEFYINNENVKDNIRETLNLLPDMERILSRVHTGRSGPRDIVAIRVGLKKSRDILEIFEHISVKFPEELKSIHKDLGIQSNLIHYLDKSLKNEVPLMARDGGFVKDEFNFKLDEYRSMHQNAKEHKDQLKQQYIEDTGINTLKIKDNNVIGFFIEVTPQHAEKIPEYFVHRQTLGSCLRYTSPELKELEHKIINSKGYAIDLEMQIFEEILQKIRENSDAIALAASAMAKLDVFLSFAQLAYNNNYCRPVLNDSVDFKIKEGRHPVVERNIAKSDLSEAFIANDCDLSDNQKMWLITGPNMAGKSTFLRQNAIIAIMAQIGSYVPAESATIGVVDKVFSRVGASDDLARGQSTFMVEMIETAAILMHATPRSLVILDEIGRGTATFDGLSIAWAVLEYLHEHNKSRTLFATHYHEITHLSEKLENLVCYTVKVKEWKNDIIFMHEIIAGSADRSYGIHVGKIAGLPEAVINRSEEILNLLQEGESGSAVNRLISDLPLFSYSNIEFINKEKSDSSPKKTGNNADKIYDELKELEINKITPMQAINILFKLKELI